MIDEIITYGVIGILGSVVLLLLFCTVCTIAGVIKHGVDVEKETEMK